MAVVVDFVEHPNLVDFVERPNLVDFVVGLYVLLIWVALLNCPEIPVYPSLLDHSTTISRRSDT